MRSTGTVSSAAVKLGCCGVWPQACMPRWAQRSTSHRQQRMILYTDHHAGFACTPLSGAPVQARLMHGAVFTLLGLGLHRDTKDDSAAE